MLKIIFIHSITAGILFALSFFVSGSLDIAVYDTYFVISYAYLIIIMAVLFVIFALTTWIIHQIERKLSPILNGLHYALTCLCVATLVIFLYYPTHQSRAFQDYSVLHDVEYHQPITNSYEWITKVIVILIITQFLFLINVYRAFVIEKKN